MGVFAEIEKNLFKYEVLCDPIDKFIMEQREKDCSLTYMHVVIAAIVRLIALRPQLNRFVVNGRVFKRKNICVSYVVKKSLRDDVEETTVKLELTGKETIYEIKEMISSKSPYYIQSFKDSGKILHTGLSSCDKDTLEQYLKIIQKKILNAQLRGID